ncbi:hypothetical protein EB796_022790 [Bugula neritina]|uniref:RRM domain-containing protein n=1 Tax=Bugula neritina TaxID=10212 RepID=A0A7J7IYL5_BUGNE|nr:hypothetical protein EB796_022790 [Bugula neritina]
MPGELVVRLRNLSWSASATDIRGFFRGLDIPNGGVKIIGGDDGDCFVLFTTEADAHNALRKDGMYLNDQRIRLDPSNEDEMQYIIAIAKGETPKPPVYDQPDVFQSRKRPGSPSERHQPPYKFTGRPDNHRDPNEKDSWQDHRNSHWNSGVKESNYMRPMEESSNLPSQDRSYHNRYDDRK